MPKYIRGEHAVKSHQHQRATAECHACHNKWSRETLAENELDATNQIAQSVPSLQCVEWATWYDGGKARISIDRGPQGQIMLVRKVLQAHEWTRDVEDQSVERSIADGIAWGCRGGKFEDLKRRRRIWYW